MPLSAVTRDLVEIEPTEVYNQLDAILREKEGSAGPDLYISVVEAVAFTDQHFDAVLCITAHQYFDICNALPDFAYSEARRRPFVQFSLHAVL